MKPVFVFYALFTLVLLSWGLHQALDVAPTEQTMGDIQRIFYYHVPSAWVSFLCFFANFLASIWYLASKNLKADAIAVSTAEVGVVFCSIVLVTGPLWAKPVWGIWWTWDARLTSTFIMWLIYISYLLLRRFSTADEQTPKLAAALAIFGFVDVPIVYMSIRWWRTQHPSPVIFGEAGQSGLDPAMLTALLVNIGAFLCYGALVFAVRYKLERARQALREVQAIRSI